MIPVLVAIGESSPPKSKAEMLAIAAVVNVITYTLPDTLGLDEEYCYKLDDKTLAFMLAPSVAKSPDN